MTDLELIQALRLCSAVNCGECLKTHTVCLRRKWMSDAADRLVSLLAENERLKQDKQVMKYGFYLLKSCTHRRTAQHRGGGVNESVVG